jgi:hypothetical protein
MGHFFQDFDILRIIPINNEVLVSAEAPRKGRDSRLLAGGDKRPLFEFD